MIGRKAKRRREMPLEYSLMLTATLCLLAFGAVMVFSASSTTQILGGHGDGAYYFKRTVIVGLAGLLLMRVLSLRGTKAIRAVTPALMLVAMFLLLVVLIPGVGTSTNGAQRWIGGGLFQVQPSEIAKLALILYGANLLASKPKMVRDIQSMMPFLLVVGVCALLVVVEPDLGTAMVVSFSVAAMLIAAGANVRDLGKIALVLATLVLLMVLVQPYMRERLFGFLHPGANAAGAGFQAAQAKIALGSGGLFGVGLGQGVQKAFYLPEAHTDMIAAVVGEEIGFLGIGVLVSLFSLFGYAGFRTAQKARDRYQKLLVAGLTALVLTQATINLFAVMGMAPVTGVPLPFVSYGNSSLLVMLAASGLILNVARRQPAPRRAPRKRAPAKSGRRTGAGARGAPVLAGAGGARLQLIHGGGRSASAKGRNSGGRHGGSRGAGDRRRRRAAR
ncbi:MAG: cell division protein FtsW [Solirubrobacterales bacterium]|nr:cell division protein FtsW [Solirubrobacterales bacterium]